MKKTAVAVLMCFGLPALTAFIGSIASRRAQEYYSVLERPPWSPPSWLFGPVWTALYLMMGLAAFLVWRKGQESARPALTLFFVHLIFNALWSWIFFAWRMPGWAFVEIVALWLMIAALTVLFYRIHRVAGLLLAPYLAWVTFASALNFEIWRRN